VPKLASALSPERDLPGAIPELPRPEIEETRLADTAANPPTPAPPATKRKQACALQRLFFAHFQTRPLFMFRRTLMNELIRTTWHHAPEHRFIPGLCYMLTGSTLYKQNFYPDSWRLRELERIFFECLEESGWIARAWALFSNHWHLVAKALEGGATVKQFIQGFHSRASIWVNREDDTPGRTVWYQYWDRSLTFESSYWARLNYVSQNPVRHGLVRVASQYPFCSAGFYETRSGSAFRRKLASYRFDRVKEHDDFDPIWLR
jgi:putative transposase